MNDTTQKVEAIIQQLYDTFVRENIHRVYECRTCKRCWGAKHLLKKPDETRVCPVCRRSVYDITFTPLGKAWQDLVRTDLEVDIEQVRSKVRKSSRQV